MDYARYVVKTFVSDPFSVRQMHFEWGTTFLVYSQFYFNSTLFKCLGKLLFSSVIRAERVHFSSAAVFTLKMHTESICFHFNGSNTNPLPFSTIYVTSLGESKQK